MCKRIALALFLLLLPALVSAQTVRVDPRQADDGSIPAGATNSDINAFGMGFDGTVWRRVTFGTAGTASAQVWTVQGIASMTPLAGNITQVNGSTFSASNPLFVSPVSSGAAVTPLTTGAGPVTADTARTSESTDSQLSADIALIKTALQLIDNAQTGDSAFYRTSAGATEDEHEVKATAGVLYSVALTNTNASPRYWRCYNLTAANTTPGTSTVYIGLAIPGNTGAAGFTHTFGPNGVAFSTALTCTFTTGAADTDVAEVAANEIKATYTFK